MAGDPLTAIPTADEQILLDCVAKIYLLYTRWPSWAWVDETLERQDLNASVIVADMPTEPTHAYGWLAAPRHQSPASQDQVRLSVAGLRHTQLGGQVVREFCLVVGALGTIRSNVRLDPFANEAPVTTRSDIIQLLRVPELGGAEILDLLAKEPATWHCQVKGDRDANWTMELSPQVRRFAGIRTIDEYLERLASLLAPVVVPDQPTYPVSPFSLPAAIDYLDTVWQLKFEKPLVGSPGIERSARLAFDVSSSEEADSALSALAEVLKGLCVPGSPGVDGHPLQRITQFLAGKLPEEAIPRVTDAVAILDASRVLRAGAQHVGAQAKAVGAHAVLELPWPVADWAAAWARVQAVAAHAFNVIREELQALG